MFISVSLQVFPSVWLFYIPAVLKLIYVNRLIYVIENMLRLIKKKLTKNLFLNCQLHMK